jgi:hypothetical protein
MRFDQYWRASGRSVRTHFEVTEALPDAVLRRNALIG